MEKIHLKNLDIILDNNKKEYQSGDQISGLLKISINGKLLLSNIKIGLVCMAEVDWTEKPGNLYQRHGVYRNKKKILDLMYEMPERDADNCLGEGEHTIPFRLGIPEKDIPPSFQSSMGSVTYNVEAIIYDPAIDEVHRIGCGIIVDSPLCENLNLSVSGSTEKDLGMFNIGSGNLSLSACISKKGFIAGELIEVDCMVENSSTLDAIPRATLYQTQIYMCGERHKSLEIALTDPVVGTEVGKETNNTQTLLISIPKEAVLSIKSPIISIKYFIHLTLDIPHSIDLHLDLPIVVTNLFAINKYKSAKKQ